jgi:hypothetical protein
MRRAGHGCNGYLFPPLLSGRNLMAGQYARAAEARVITLSCNGSFPDLDFNNTATPNKPKAGDGRGREPRLAT